MRAGSLAAWLAPLVAVTGCAVVLGISEGELAPPSTDGGAAAGDANDDAPTAPPDGLGPDGAVADAAFDAPVAPLPCTPLVDDLDDGNSQILACIGRKGAWSGSNDNSKGGIQVPADGVQLVPTAGGADGGGFAAHTTGKGFTARGAEIRVSLNSPDQFYSGTIDVSAYSGISFWAKSKTLRDIYVNVPDRNRYAPANVCKGSLCGDYFGDGIQIGTTWAKKTVKFASMSPDVAGGSATIDKAHVYGIEFHVAPKSDAGTGAPFDFWIDDVTFVP